VELHRSDGDREAGALGQEEEMRQLVGLGDEDWVHRALETGEDVCAEVLEQVSGE
jgi:hypothetical protein